MGFSWTAIVRYETEIAAAHINQVKTNVDSVYTDLELAAYNWLYLPVSVGDEMQHEDFKEMRDAIDYADDMNYCRSHDVSYMGADDEVARGVVYTGENTGYDSGYKLGVDGAYRSTVYSSQKSGYDSTYNSGVDNDHNSGVDNSDEVTVCSPVQSGFYAQHYSGDDASAATVYTPP